MFVAQPTISDVEGRTRVVVLPTPNAGAEFSMLVPDGVYWDVLGIDATLKTSGAVANRQPVFLFDDGANVFWRVPAPAVQAAGATVDYVIGQGVTATGVVAAVALAPMPDPFRIFAGYRIRSATALIDAADQYNLTVFVREWIINAVSGPRAASRRNASRFGAPRRPGRAY